MLTSLGTLTPFAARIYGAAVMLAPPLLLASTVAFITEGEGINEGVLGGTIGVWSVFTMAIALVGILRLVEPAAPRAAACLTVLALVACAGGAAFNVQAVSTGVFGAGAEIVEEVEGSDSIAILAFLPWGLFFPLTFILTGIVLWRTRTVPWWVGALTVAAGVLFVASRPERIEVLAIVADLTMVAALAPIGWAMVSGSSARAPITSSHPSPSALVES